MTLTNTHFWLAPGNNIALKVPDHLFNATLQFYRDLVKLQPASSTQAFQFGDGGKQILWLDRVQGVARSDVWLELRTADLKAAKEFFLSQGVTVADDMEPLPPGYQGFWIINPAGVVHLVSLYGE